MFRKIMKWSPRRLRLILGSHTGLSAHLVLTDITYTQIRSPSPRLCTHGTNTLPNIYVSLTCLFLWNHRKYCTYGHCLSPCSHTSIHSINILSTYSPSIVTNAKSTVPVLRGLFPHLHSQIETCRLYYIWEKHNASHSTL